MLFKKTITLQIGRVMAFIVSTGLLLVMLQVLYWSSQPSQVLVVKNSPVPVQPIEIKDGAKVFLTIDYCKTSGAIGTSEVNLVGETAGAKIAISWPKDNSPKQCILLTDVPFPIPAQTPTDNYHVEFVICYNVNPLKHPCTTFTSKPFHVANSKLSPGDAKASP